VPTPDVRSRISGDLYANLQAFDPQGANATIKLIVEPLVPWIWFGGMVIVIGAIIGMFHKGRRLGPPAHTAAAPVAARVATEAPEPAGVAGIIRADA
jgi:cytochrome c-type biogenesis protein CcmF